MFGGREQSFWTLSFLNWQRAKVLLKLEFDTKDQVLFHKKFQGCIKNLWSFFCNFVSWISSQLSEQKEGLFFYEGFPYLSLFFKSFVLFLNLCSTFCPQVCWQRSFVTIFCNCQNPNLTSTQRLGLTWKWLCKPHPTHHRNFSGTCRRAREQTQC